MNQESFGEKTIRLALDELGLRYVPEQEITFLKGDSKKSRRADFYLPRQDVYIGFVGGWEAPDPDERESERNRYREKMRVYKQNGVDCIWVFPKQLHYAPHRIKMGLDEIREERAKRKPERSVFELVSGKWFTIGLAAIIIGFVLMWVSMFLATGGTTQTKHLQSFMYSGNTTEPSLIGWSILAVALLGIGAFILGAIVALVAFFARAKLVLFR